MGASTSGETSSTGVELGRRVEGRELSADRTAPHHFIGAKMAEHVRCVWLNAEGFFLYDFCSSAEQEDADVGRFLRLFTELRYTRSKA